MTLSDAQVSHLLAMLKDAIDFDIRVDNDVKEEDGEKYVAVKAGSMDVTVEIKVFLTKEALEALTA